MVLLLEPMLGSLTRWLRLIGLDARRVERPPAVVAPGHLLLTRRRALAGRPGVLLLGADQLGPQLRQVLTHLGHSPDPARFFSRCLQCNTPVQPLDRAAAQGRVPDHTWHNVPSFTQCPTCHKIFWPGSHGQRAALFLREAMGTGGGRI